MDISQDLAISFAGFLDDFKLITEGACPRKIY